MPLMHVLMAVLAVSPADDPWPKAKQPLTRSLAGGQSHRYFVELPKDVALSARLEQHGIDAVVEVHDPSGQILVSFDAPTGREGPEVAEWVSGEGGRFALVVRPFVAQAEAGTYTLSVEAARPATGRDRDLMAARREIARGYERRTVFDYAAARAAGERGLELVRRAVGDDAVETADASDLLGYVYDEIGLFEKGATMFEASLAIRRHAPGVPDLVRDETENNLAWLEMGAGRYADAERRFRSVAERREKQGGDGLRRAENSRTGQGVALAHMDRFREAEQVQRAAIARAEKRTGSNAPVDVWMLRQLGLTLLEAGQAAEAEQLCARTLEAPRNDQWARLSRATDLRCLASARAAQGRLAEVEPLFVEALEVCARELGRADTLCAANVLADQGRASARAGRTQRARETLERAEKIRAAVLPATHPEVVEVRAELTKLAAR